MSFTNLITHRSRENPMLVAYTLSKWQLLFALLRHIVIQRMLILISYFGINGKRKLVVYKLVANWSTKLWDIPTPSQQIMLQTTLRRISVKYSTICKIKTTLYETLKGIKHITSKSWTTVNQGLSDRCCLFIRSINTKLSSTKGKTHSLRCALKIETSPFKDEIDWLLAQQNNKRQYLLRGFSSIKLKGYIMWITLNKHLPQLCFLWFTCNIFLCFQKQITFETLNNPSPYLVIHWFFLLFFCFCFFILVWRHWACLIISRFKWNRI